MAPVEPTELGSAGRLEVRFFASLAERTGVSTETIDLDPGARVVDLWAALEERHPELRNLGYRPLVACDGSYAGWDDSLDGIVEVAFLPPVSGG